MRSRKLKNHSFLLLCTALLILSFQNCSPNNMNFNGVNPDSTDLASSIGMVIENGAPASNKKVLDVKFVNLQGDYRRMRLSATETMNDTDNPWQTYSTDTEFDLGTDWSGDGKHDGPKTVYAELFEDTSQTVIKLKASIAIDTIAPTGSAQGLMAKGLQGVIYSKGQKVDLNWLGADPKSPTGYASGFHPSEAVKISYTKQADCSSSSATTVMDWSPYRSDYTQFAWPAANPVDAFISAFI